MTTPTTTAPIEVQLAIRLRSILRHGGFITADDGRPGRDITGLVPALDEAVYGALRSAGIHPSFIRMDALRAAVLDAYDTEAVAR